MGERRKRQKSPSEKKKLKILKGSEGVPPEGI